MFLFLLPVFFVVHGWQTWYKYIDFSDVLTLTGMYLLLAGAVFLLTRIFVRNHVKAALFSFLLLVLFFFWGYIIDHAKVWMPGFFLSRIIVLVPVLLAAIILLTVWFGRAQPAVQQRVVYYLNLLLLLYIGADCGIMLYRQATMRAGSKVQVQQLQQSRARGKMGWNVYLIVFDEYGNATSLKQNLGYDNSDIDSFLQAKGFSVQHSSRSNYNLTQFSMASLLNMSYLNGIPASHIIGFEEYNNCVSIISNNQVVKTFKDAGYDFENYSVFNINDQPAIADEFFLPVKTRLITANTFYERQMSVYPWWLVRGKSKIGFLWERYYFKGYRGNNRVFEKLVQAAGKDNTRPRFVYAHLMLPHPPYYYDSTGRLGALPDIYKASKDLDPQHYLYSVRYANGKIKELVEKIQQQENAAIIIMGDHGFRKVVNSPDSALFFSNFNAVYFPDKNYTGLYDSISNVNMFRIVLNKVLHTQFPVLPDSTVLLEQRKDLRDEDAANN